MSYVNKHHLGKVCGLCSQPSQKCNFNNWGWQLLTLGLTYIVVSVSFEMVEKPRRGG